MLKLRRKTTDFSNLSSVHETCCVAKECESNYFNVQHAG